MSRALLALLPAALVGLLLALPGAAEACAVCMAGRDEQSRIAFIFMTAFLTFLPFLLLGGGLWWLRRRIRRLEAARETRPGRAAPVGTGAGA